MKIIQNKLKNVKISEVQKGEVFTIVNKGLNIWTDFHLLLDQDSTCVQSFNLNANAHHTLYKNSIDYLVHVYDAELIITPKITT